jgi:hypothetical protein
MGNLGYFNSDEVQPNSGNDPIPDGRYVVVITKSEVKPTKAGDGKYLDLTMQVVDGPFKGRQFWPKLNIQNKSEKAQQIGLGQLSAICKAVGRSQIQDSSQLHNIPFKVSIGVEDGLNGEKQNRLKAVLWKETAAVAGRIDAPAAAQLDDDAVPF